MNSNKRVILILTALIIFGSSLWSHLSRFDAGTKKVEKWNGHQSTGSKFSLSSYGEADDSRFESYYEDYFKLIPDEDMRVALKTHLNEIAQIHGGANESIETVNQKLLDQNPCFAELATEFYLNYLKENLLNLRWQMDKQKNLIPGRFTLDQEAGKGSWKDKQPGFLWDDLMALSKKQPNVAIAIIRLCGHDDGINKQPELSSQHRSFSRLKNKQKKIISTVERIWPNAPDGIVEFLVETKNSQSLEFSCLPNSLLLLPKSMGQEIDIKNSLKKKIASIQAPTKGPSALPAKYYHVLAAMYTGCFFKQTTGYSYLGANLARMEARMYRAKTLAQKYLVVSEGLKPSGWDKIGPDFLSDTKIKYLIEQRSLHNTTLGTSNSIDNMAIRFLPSEEEIKQMTINEIRKHMWYNVSIYDAAILWKKWYKEYTLPGVGKVWLPNKARRPEFTDQLELDSFISGNNTFLRTPPLSPGFGSLTKCEESWEPQRCRDALAVINSWEVDFEWSEEEHWLGARFGEEVCRKLNEGEIH